MTGEVVSINHESGTKDVSIPNASDTGVVFGMNSGCIVSVYWDAPDVNAYFTAESKENPGGTYREVKNPDGTQWTFPDDASNLTAAGCIGANAFADFVGLGEVRLKASATQTNGWTIKVRVSG